MNTCPFCSGPMTTENGWIKCTDETCAIGYHAMTVALWERAAYRKELVALTTDNRGLKSVVFACSKEPMPEWSKTVWDLHEKIKELQKLKDGYRKVAIAENRDLLLRLLFFC